MVGKTKDDLGGLFGAEWEALVSIRVTAGRDLAVERTVNDYVQCPIVLIPPVERDTDLDNILGVFKVVLDTTPPDSCDKVALTRPARVGSETAIPSVFGNAAVRAATRIGVSRVISSGIHHHGCLLACIDKRCYWLGGRYTRKREGGGVSTSRGCALESLNAVRSICVLIPSSVRCNGGTEYFKKR